MHLAEWQNLFGKPSHKIQRDGFNNYTQPPAPATPSNPAIEAESGNIITDENGNPIGAN
jgi:hypothetical protein